MAPSSDPGTSTNPELEEAYRGGGAEQWRQRRRRGEEEEEEGERRAAGGAPPSPPKHMRASPGVDMEILPLTAEGFQGCLAARSDHFQPPLGIIVALH